MIHHYSDAASVRFGDFPIGDRVTFLYVTPGTRDDANFVNAKWPVVRVSASYSASPSRYHVCVLALSVFLTRAFIRDTVVSALAESIRTGGFPPHEGREPAARAVEGSLDRPEWADVAEAVEEKLLAMSVLDS